MTDDTDPIRAARARSSYHRLEIQASRLCGCFYCCTVYSPISIKEWIDKDCDGLGQTALCPRCGIDSVIGDKSGFEISVDFMASMERYWFGIRKA